MKLLEEKGFEDAKDFIREGISHRLNSYENEMNDQQFTINTKPRDCYKLPDLLVADVENEKVEGANLMAGLFKKKMRMDIRDGLLENLSEEQAFVKRQQDQKHNPSLLTKEQFNYLQKQEKEKAN